MTEERQLKEALMRMEDEGGVPFPILEPSAAAGSLRQAQQNKRKEGVVGDEEEVNHEEE